MRLYILCHFHLVRFQAFPHSSLKQSPVLDLKALQDLLLHSLTILHQLRLTPFLLRPDVLSSIMRDIDRDHDVRLLLLQPQQQHVDVGKLRDFPARIVVGAWWRLDESQSLQWVVAVWKLVRGRIWKARCERL